VSGFRVAVPVFDVQADMTVSTMQTATFQVLTLSRPSLFWCLKLLDDGARRQSHVVSQGFFYGPATSF
jgi:hypothetical protein